MLLNKLIIMKANSGKSREVLIPYRSGPIRFLILFLVCMVVFGNQYAFNNPQALEDSLQKQLGITEFQFQLFYTIFSFPNIFATFTIGFLIDILGVRIGIIALTSGIAIFQTVIAVGGYTYSYHTILIGRLLFGLSSEGLITAQAALVSFWFKGKQLSFAIGIAVTFPQLGNALNSLVTPMIFDATQSLGTAFLVSVFLCLFSTCCAFTAAYIDKTADRVDEENRIRIIQYNTGNNHLGEGPIQEEEEERQSIKCQDLKQFQWSFWLVLCIGMFSMSLYVPFMDNANRLYQKRFCFTQLTAGKALILPYIIAAVCSPFLGLLVDKVGHKRYFIMMGLSMFTIGQIFILAYPQCISDQLNGSVVGLVFIGLGYCFYGNCIVPSIPLIVKRKVTGSAFGLMQMIQSIALCSLPLISGAIVQNAPSLPVGYTRSSLFFVFVGILAVIVSMGLLFVPDKIKITLDKRSKYKFVGQVNGKIIYTDSQIYKSSSQQYGGIQIVQQNTDNNFNGSLLKDKEKKQLQMIL